MSELIKKDFYERIGRNISYFRRKSELTQTQLADKLFTTQSAISNYEYGKKLNIDIVIQISKFFEISLQEFMFRDFQKEENAKKNEDTNSESAVSGPISKCADRTYFCYYIKEQNNGSSKYTTRIYTIEIKVLSPETQHSAKVSITFLEKPEKSYEGRIVMDESYAYVQFHDLRRDLYMMLTFFYYRKSVELRYKGGLGMLQKLDQHSLPICQFCVISVNEIAAKKQDGLEKFLKIDVNQNKGTRLSTWRFSSSAVLRLTKSKDNEVFKWLQDNIGI